MTLLSCRTRKKEMQDIRVKNDIKLIHVNDFGALGDGKRDDSKAIQDAINFACASKSETHVLFDESKTYLITKAIRVSCSYIKIDLNNATIDASNLKILDKNEYSPAFVCFGNVSYGQRMDFSEISYIVQKRNKSEDKNLREKYVRISNDELSQKERSYYKKSEFISINDVARDKNKTKSILTYTKPVLMEEINFVESIKIVNGSIKCSKIDYTIGIQFNMARNCEVNNVQISNTSVSGISFDRSILCNVDSCVVLSPKADMIGLDYGIVFTESQFCKAGHNYLETSKTGIDLTNSHFILIESNKTKNCGISPHAGTNITVQKNILQNGSIYFRSFRSKIIENEITISNSGLGGIVLAELYGKDSIRIIANKIKFENINSFHGERGDSFGTGIHSGEVNLKKIAISDNHISGAINGIAVYRADNEKGNKDLTIVNNSIDNCFNIGINASRYSNVKITGNTINGVGSKTIGISMWESGGIFENIEITNNQIRNVDIGIRVTKGYKLGNMDTNKISDYISHKIYYQNE